MSHWLACFELRIGYQINGFDLQQIDRKTFHLDPLFVITSEVADRLINWHDLASGLLKMLELAVAKT